MRAVTPPVTPPARRPVAMLTHSYYEEDPRVRREAEALVAAGRPVDVFALRRPGDDAEAVIDGVRVHRLDVQRHQGAGLGTYLREYLAFLVRAGWAVTRAHRRRHYALVQVHTLPDFLVVRRRCRSGPWACRSSSTSTRRCRSSSGSASRARPARSPGAPCGLQERLSIRAASAVVTVNEALARPPRRAGRPAGSRSRSSPTAPSLARFDPATVNRPARSWPTASCGSSTPAP